ncbi:argininosuccinate lyase [Candidatus Magnetominusculus xianensis]|uniref:Argininosuccinate lyase n=1 Tax=Candidatus Magnetominusculus xianensis TaxID=1748249 RepID=A0ABR5SGD5_9BACT|nr:argininosuccinate lyase [Candidatus Magnetominusculus xianensis]KWT88349.1 argininosuccinate lyase [Candidatus Magnetominusculus xianensis]MBF0405446.1 argininosuccinate lyase [Nitrospirota bacterium]
MSKLWSGRFTEETAKSVEQFTESISFDKRLWADDIRGSIAHAEMLSKQGIITEEEAKEIIDRLREIEREIDNNKFEFDEALEDIHMNIEAALIKKYPEAGKKLHTARSRNDQVALDIRLYLQDLTEQRLLRLIIEFQKTLITVAQTNIDTIMPGYTHMQRAQPVTLAHHLLAYVEMFERDKERYTDALKRINTLPLGACALAGTTLNIDRKHTAELLKFSRIADNSIDAVSDRDFVIEFISNSSILMMHLSRMAEELVLWSTKEFSFIEISDAYTTGSSIMPQKKNPDVAELIRGKTGRVYGALVSILTTMKALPLAYNRDMQEDKEPLFDVIDTVTNVLHVINDMFKHIKFNKERLRKTAAEGFSLATDLAEYLVTKKMPFREAHEVTGNIVKYCIDNSKDLHELTIEGFKGFSDLIENDIYSRLTIEASVRGRKSFGGTGEVEEQIKRLRKKVGMERDE